MIFFISCNNQDILPPDNTAASTITELNYPANSGTSGDTLTSVLGYGYDALGLCDTLSVRAQVLTLNNKGNLIVGYPRVAEPSSIISGANFLDFVYMIHQYPFRTELPDTVFIAHIKSLLTLASGSNAIDYNCALAYYSFNITMTHCSYFINSSHPEQEVTPEFESDINTLTPEQIVQKYGTHVLTSVYKGAKFEMLYKCDTENGSNSGFDGNLYKRMNEFLGYAPGYIEYDVNESKGCKNEQLIYNSLGCRSKLFGVINATDNNSDSIRIDIASLFNDNIEEQFFRISKDGIIPLYAFISDPIKKQAVKSYIDNYLSNLY